MRLEKSANELVWSPSISPYNFEIGLDYNDLTFTTKDQSINKG